MTEQDPTAVEPDDAETAWMADVPDDLGELTDDDLDGTDVPEADYMTAEAARADPTCDIDERDGVEDGAGDGEANDTV